MSKLSTLPLWVRQGASFVLVGLLQLLLDWVVFVALSGWGVSPASANVLGRVAGAVLGFWLNGRITFAGNDTRIGGTQLRRFITMWLCTTTASTLAIGHIDEVFGLQWAWIAKPMVELSLGVIGFLLSRHWIYRH